MQVREYAGPSFLVLAVTLWMLGCGETPTSPGAPSFKKGKPPTQAPKVTVANLNLASTFFTIGGDGVLYEVDIVNSGGKETGVILQGEIAQGNALRGAGGTMLTCESELGLLAHGTCHIAFGAGASNSNGGAGTLMAGPAFLLLKVLRPDGSMLAGITVPITLQ